MIDGWIYRYRHPRAADLVALWTPTPRASGHGAQARSSSRTNRRAVGSPSHVCRRMVLPSEQSSTSGWPSLCRRTQQCVVVDHRVTGGEAMPAAYQRYRSRTTSRKDASAETLTALASDSYTGSTLPSRQYSHGTGHRVDRDWGRRWTPHRHLCLPVHHGRYVVEHPWRDVGEDIGGPVGACAGSATRIGLSRGPRHLPLVATMEFSASMEDDTDRGLTSFDVPILRLLYEAFSPVRHTVFCGCALPDPRAVSLRPEYRADAWRTTTALSLSQTPDRTTTIGFR